MSSLQHDVIVVGAGPSGLALAIELGTRGISCLVVERNDRVGYAPRAKTTNVRTRTHLRRWGIADRLAALAPFGVDYPSTVRFVTRLGGYQLAQIEDASNCNPARNSLYPEHGQWVPQYKLEQTLRERAEELASVTLSFSTECVAVTQDDYSATVKLRDLATGEEKNIVSAYVVGADGARSVLRDIVGASMSGKYGLSRNYNIVFRAPGLAEAHPHGPGTMYWQVNPSAPSLIGPMDEGDIWFFMPTRFPDGFEITPSSAASLIREATGIDLPYEILSSDEWVASSLVADRYRDRRLFLVGDACHLHPPFGGYGMNMGVADGVDLGWKLAATLQGWGGPVLLDSYEIERRSIHEEVIAEASANHSILSNDFWSSGLEAEGDEGDALRDRIGQQIVELKEREFHTLGTVLGGCYLRSPIVSGHADLPRPEGGFQGYVPSSNPGCLAPHIWCADGSSLYDAFGKGFALIIRPELAGDETDLAARSAAARNIALSLIPISESDAAGRYPYALTLVRPDQYVAWRGNNWTNEALDRASGWGPPEQVATRAEASMSDA